MFKSKACLSLKCYISSLECASLETESFNKTWIEVKRFEDHVQEISVSEYGQKKLIY